MNLLTLLDVFCLGANDVRNYVSCGMTVYQMFMYYDGMLIAYRILMMKFIPDYVKFLLEGKWQWLKVGISFALCCC